MENPRIQFPLDVRFKLVAFSGQIAVHDAAGSLICYVRQKAFKLRENVTVFGDEAQTRPLYRISADRILDISARYTIARQSGETLGVLQRRGMRSIWRAQYEVHRDGQPLLAIAEENPWVKLLDGLIGQIPIVGIFTGYMLQPAYGVSRVTDGARVLRVVKRPALFEGHFRVDSIEELGNDDAELAVLSVLMMLLLERSRG